MRNTILDDLIREIRRGDRKAIDLLLSDRKLTAVPKIASVVGWDRVGDFVREQLLRRVGSKNQSLSEWLESIPELTMTTWLVVRLKAHDTEVWNHWLQQNIDWLLKWTQSSVGVCPGHGGDASDVVQIAFAELARAIPRSISTYEQFLAFVRTILRRRAIDLSRKKLLTVLEQSSGDSTNRAQEILGRHSSSTTTPSQKAMRGEREEQIIAAAPDELPNNELLVVLLKQCDKCCFRDIALGLGLSRVEIAKIYYRALESLRGMVDQLDIGMWNEGEDTVTEKILRALQELPEKQRIALELGIIEKYSLSETACVMGYFGDAGNLEDSLLRKKSEDAVAALKYRGLKALRQSLSTILPMRT